MIKLIDTKATIKFIPSCEKGSKNPTTFYVKPATWRNSIMLAQLFDFKKVKDREQAQITNDQAWIDYMASRIEKIDNVGEVPADPTEIANYIEAVLSSLPVDIGNELLTFIMGNTNLNETQAKN